MTLLSIVFAVLAGGVAALLRWSVSLAFSQHSLPWAVLVVNVVASALGGITLGLAETNLIDDGIRLLLLSGIAGGLSTFSTWSVESVGLVQEGRWRVALGSITANLVLGITAAAIAYALVTWLLG